MQRTLEICVDTVTSAVAAARAGADRIELCENLAQGGVTPSAGKIRRAVALAGVPVFVLVRPRPGDFLYSDEEFALLLADIRLAKELGAAGIVSGAVGPQGQPDPDRTRQMVEAAGSLPFTFHRAFDHLRDPRASIDVLAGLGVARILTAGGAGTAPEGRENLAHYVEWAGGRLQVMAGGGVRPPNVEALLSIPGLREIHSSARRPYGSPMRNYARQVLGLTEEQAVRELDWAGADPEVVRALKRLVAGTGPEE